MVSSYRCLILKGDHYFSIIGKHDVIDIVISICSYTHNNNINFVIFNMLGSQLL